MRLFSLLPPQAIWEWLGPSQRLIFETTLAMEQQHWSCCLEWKARSASGASDGRWCRSLSEDTRLGIEVDD